MASVAEPEVQFAQKLASNEKPARKKAVRKLRKYISARSRRETGGFSEEELLKLWKGLFYCLWMQDKPLLQEELSTQISGLIHHFHSFSSQLLFLNTFLSTMKREWTGIDRLRMDKFFQLVRFMFRQMFEVLQRSRWDPSCVGFFLELLSSQLLHGGAPPVGLQLHVLDLYLRELAAVGAQQLSADQNLTFIKPFCKTAAKTKDRCLFRAICNSIFSVIIDQAPFAIEELLKEVESSDQASDSGQASDEQDEQEMELKSRRKEAKKTKATKQINGTKSHSEEDDDKVDEDDEVDELSESELPFDEDVGPVLQFDYGAVADKLLEASSRGNTPSRNRQRLYKIVRVLRDLSQGSFPQDEYPEEVSTDEDDEDFGSRKRMKRKHTEEEDEGPDLKKVKGKKVLLKPSGELNGNVSSEEVTKKKKKKSPHSQTEPLSSVLADMPKAALTPEPQPQVLPEPQPENKKKKKKKKKRKGTASVKEDNSSETCPGEANLETGQTVPQLTEQKNQKASETLTICAAKNTEKKDLSEEQEHDRSSQLEPKKTSPSVETDLSTDTVPEKKTNEHKLPENTAEGGNKTGTQTKAKDTACLTQKKKKKKLSVGADDSEAGGQEQENDTQTGSTTQPEQKKKKKKAVSKALENVPETVVEEKHEDSEVLMAPETEVKTTRKRKSVGETCPTNITQKKKKSAQPGPEEDTETAPDKKKKRRKIPVEFEYEAEEVQSATPSDTAEDTLQTPPSSKPHQKKSVESGFVCFQSSVSPPTPLFCRPRGPHTALFGKTKCVTPKTDSKKVRFGLKNNKTAEFKKTDRSLLVSPDGSSRVPFDPKQKPKCGVLKSPPTPVQKKKKTAGWKKTVGVRARPTAADFF